MRKEKFLSVLASMAFLLLFGAVSGHAQKLVDATPPPTPSGTSIAVASPYDVTGINFVSPAEAIDILQAEVDLLLNSDPSNMTEEEEANQGLRLYYYPHLSSLIQNYGSVGAAMPVSSTKLIEIVDSHKSGLGLDPVVIYQETIGLLSN